MELYEKLLQLKKENKPYVLATVVATEGRAPRSPGCKLLCCGDGTVVGTVGGGSVERQTLADCQVLMHTGRPALREYSFTTGEQKTAVTVFLEPSEPQPCLYLCGCGHVAQAVLPLAKKLGYYVVCIDARDVSAFSGALEPADEVHVLQAFAQLEHFSFRPDAAVVACAFSHAADGEILKAVLKKDISFLGMLGGKHKIRHLFGMLLDCGYERQQLEKIHAPIGLDLGGETPEEIALAVMAEILAARRGGSCRPMKEVTEAPWPEL